MQCEGPRRGRCCQRHSARGPAHHTHPAHRLLFDIRRTISKSTLGSQAISALFAVALLGVFLVLYTLFRTVNLALQVMAALPMAFIGSVAALVLTGQTITIAAMVGFISLAGIASRNGVLLLQHYLHLVEHEGESFTKEMIVRAGLERLAPVLMTALTAGIALVPLVLAAGEPGKEILYPVATVILGGVISSTMLDFLCIQLCFGCLDYARLNAR